MILVDISSTLHRMIFGSTNDPRIRKDENGELITEDFIKTTLSYIMEELIIYQTKYKKYGNMVICFDDYTKQYWRRDVYSGYKASRKTARTASIINYREVFKYTNKLFEMIREHTPWKCVYVNRAEADDVILVLAKEFYHEGILILSPDKDFIQCQRLPNIVQYSALTNKWILPENKNTDMAEWINQHVMLGDIADGVPKVVDHVDFSDAFTEYLKSFDCSKYPETENLETLPTSVYEFNNLSTKQKEQIIKEYDVKSVNRKGQETGYDIFKPTSFGPSNIEKIHSGKWAQDKMISQLKDDKKALRDEFKKSKDPKIKEKIVEIDNYIKNPPLCEKCAQEYLDEFLDSNPLYRKHYDRNFELVMEEGIPDYIRKNILIEYESSLTEYHMDIFNEYLQEMDLLNIQAMLPKVFSSNEKLDITNCGW